MIPDTTFQYRLNDNNISLKTKKSPSQPQSLSVIRSVSCTYNFAFSRTLCKCNHYVMQLLSVVSFTWLMRLRVTHVVLYIRSSFFLLLSNIPLYRYTTDSLSIHHLKDIWVVYLFLVIICKATTNINMHVFPETCFHCFWIKYLEQAL